ncbi:MAG TPA: hypothetical protein VHL54_04905 [Actinomycetota bacterium]|nr:hypothetical protein [Actinomycetota bacterium]
MLFWVCLALFGCGAAPAVAAVGLRPEAIPLSALFSALMCSAAGIAALMFAGPVLPLAVAIVLAANGAALTALRRRRPGGQTAGVVAGLVTIAVAAVPLAALRRPVVDWDARSIWSFHGRWFYAGGDYLREALDNPAFVFSHTDYPPAVPATMGVLWRLGGGIDPWVGQVATGLLNFSAVALVGLAVAGLGSHRRPALRCLTGGLAVLAVYGSAMEYAANGYVDLLWAAGVAAGAVYLLAAPWSSRNLVLGVTALLLAGLTKNEGTLVALVVLGLAALRHRTRGARLAPLGASAAVLLAWVGVARLFGAESDLSDSALDALAGRLEVGPRFGPIVEAFGRQTALFLVVGVAVTAAGWLFLRSVRDGMPLGSTFWTWTAAAGTAAILGAAYLVSPHEIRWHLATSVERTTIGLKLLILVEVLCWAAVSLEHLFGRTLVPATADD